MLRIGLLACALAYPLGTAAMTSLTPVALDLEQDTPFTRHATPEGTAPLILSGMPKTLDGLRSDVPPQNNVALCDSIRAHDLSDTADLPFDAAVIIAQALGQGLCPGESS